MRFKILVCIRGDLCDRLIELQYALDYTTSPHNVFRLEKFSPEEATEVLAVIAETEELPFDKRFITELTQQELASREDGLILPVDLQVLAWTVNRQNMSELRAFNRIAFQKIGGIEGLLTRFLQRTLDARVIPSQRQAAVKVLLALTDLDRQVRAGVLTVTALQTKLKDTLQLEAVDEATTWLARPDVRLITPVHFGETGGYELSHERLIPALMRLAGKELSEVDQVNQLLDRRVNEWLGNQRSRRYLFNWQELRLIERYKPFLIWGTKRRQKERLITQSQRSVYGKLTAVLAILLSILLGWLWWSSPTGIIWQTRRELVQLSGKVRDSTTAEAVIALARDGQFNKALRIEKSIQDLGSQVSALSAIAEAYIQLGDNAEGIKLLSQALATVEKIDGIDHFSHFRVGTLSAIAEAIGKLDDNGEVKKLLSQALATVEKMNDSGEKAWALSAISKAYIQLGDNTEGVKLLSQALATVEKIGKVDSFYSKASALSVIAGAIANLEDKEEAGKLLSQALITAEKIDNLGDKVWALSAISKAYIQLGKKTEVRKLLSQALTTAEKIDNSDDKARALSDIAEAIGKLDDNAKVKKLLSQALITAEKIDNSASKVLILSVIAEAIANLEDKEEADKLLSQALITAEKIDDSDDKARALTAIAKAYIQLEEKKEAGKLLSQALTTAENFDDLFFNPIALTDIVETQAKLGNWRKAHHAVSFCTSYNCRVQSRAKMLTVWAEQSSNPEKKQKP